MRVERLDQRLVMATDAFGYSFYDDIGLMPEGEGDFGSSPSYPPPITFPPPSPPGTGPSNPSGPGTSPASISNLELVNDTGISATDKVTSDPTVRGNIVGGFWAYGSANVEFDHNADGLGDGIAVTSSQETPFIYDPRVSDPAIAHWAGPFSLKYRAVVYDYYGNMTFQSSWQSFDMTIESGNASEISVIDEDSLNIQSGITSVDLGSTMLSSPVSHSFTIYNLGSGELTLDVPELQLPLGFRLVTPPSSSVNPYSQTSFTIEATAATSGLFQGNFSLPNNDSDESPFTFNLRVNVIGPSPEIDVAGPTGANIVAGTGAVDFGTTVVGVPINRTVTVTNSGTANLEIDPTSLQVPSGYSLVGNYASLLEPGQSTTMTFRIQAQSEGMFDGDVGFTNNDSDESPFSFQLTGQVNPNPSTPQVANLRLANNNGVSNSDRIATSPVVAGEVIGDFAGGSVLLEFDHDRDGVPNGSIGVANTGYAFTYDPRSSDASLSTFTGHLPLRYRRTHLASSGAVIAQGEWRDFDIIVDGLSTTPSGLTVSSFGLVHDTGSSNIDRVTISPVISGNVVGNFNGGSASIEFARPGTTDATGSVSVTASGETFTFDPRLADGDLVGRIGPAEVRYRVSQLNAAGVAVSVGNWTNFALTLDEPPAGSFQIENLALLNDDGSSDSDNTTTDPTLTGSVIFSGYGYSVTPSTAHTVVQYDVDNDGLVDGTTVADDSGVFEFRPVGIAYQQHTIKVRALEWDIDYATYLPGQWTSLQIHLIAAPSPEIVELSLMADTGLSNTDGITANPSVSGRVLLDGSGVAGTQVYFAIAGDSDAGGSTYTDVHGYFTYRPRGLLAGPVSLTAQSIYWDDVLQAHVYGPESTLSFTFAPPPVPDIEWIDLAVDDGVSSLDRITTIPTVVGQLKTTAIRDSVYLEFDTNSDETPDFYSSTDGYGAFVFNPVGLPVGANTVQARTKQWDIEGNSWRYSAWKGVAFTLQAPAALEVQVNTLALRNDTGISNSDSITSEPTILGTIAGTLPLGQQLVDIDLDQDGIADGQASTDSSGTFHYVPVGLALGSHTVRARSRYWDDANSAGVVGSWQSLTFTLAADVNHAPEILSIGLHSDSGVSATDNVTANPLISGQVRNADGPNDLMIEVDFDADGDSDVFTFSDADGRFFVRPESLSVGPVTVSVRAIDYDTASASRILSDWTSLTFNYQAEPPSAPLIHTVAWTSQDSEHEHAFLAGTVRDDVSVASVGIEIDSDGDRVADVVLATDWFGSFRHAPASPPFGTVTYALRTKEIDADGTTRYGSWQSYSFTNTAAPANQPPTITEFLLANDNGSSSQDGITSDPALTGVIENDDGAIGGILIQFDTNGDGAPDGSTLTNSDGHFDFLPRGLSDGTNSVSVRTKEFTRDAGVLYGAWETVTFTLESDRTTRVSTLELTNDTGQDASDGATSDSTVRGELAGDAVSNVLIFFDHDNDGLPDGNTTSDIAGLFSYVPEALPEGLVVLSAWVARGGTAGDVSSNTLRFILSETPDSPEVQEQVSELAAFDALWQSAQGSFETAFHSAVAAAAAAYNAADESFDQALNSASQEYQTALTGADAAYAAAIATADEAYAAATASARQQFGIAIDSYGDPGVTTLPMFVWPAPPPANRLVIPLDSTMPLPPIALGIGDGPSVYGINKDAGLTATVVSTVNNASNASHTRQETYQSTLSSAVANEDAQNKQAHNEYLQTMANAQGAKFEAANRTDHPTIDIAAAALAYAQAVQAANNRFDAAKQTSLDAHAPGYFYYTGQWVDGVLRSQCPTPSCSQYSGWSDGWSLGHPPVTPRDYGDIEEHYYWSMHKRYQTIRVESTKIKADYDAEIAAAEHNLNVDLAAAMREFQDKQARYNHWRERNKIQAEATFERGEAFAVEERQKKNADARYERMEIAINAAYDATMAAIDAESALQSSLNAAVQANHASRAGFFGDPGTSLAANEAATEADFDSIMAPHRLAHRRLVAQTERDSALRLALEAKNFAYAAAESTRAARIKTVNAGEKLLYAVNDGRLERNLSTNEHVETRKNKDSNASMEKRVALLDAEKTKVVDLQGPADTGEAIMARVRGDIIAYGNSFGLRQEYLTAHHNLLADSTPISTRFDKAGFTAEEVYQKAIADNQADYEKSGHAALLRLREIVAEEFDEYDTKSIDAYAVHSKEIAQASTNYLGDVAAEYQAVAAVIVPSQKNLADLEASTRKTILVNKADERRDAEVEQSQAQSQATAAWNSSLNTPWSDYQNDKAQAEKDKLVALANAGFNLFSNSAGAMLTMATSINTSSASLTLTEIATWVGHVNTVAGALSQYATDSSNTESETGDEITNKTETFEKQVASAIRTHDDGQTENQRTLTKTFESAESIFLKASADAWNDYHVAYHIANRDYYINAAKFDFGLINQSALNSAAQQKTNALAAAALIRDNAIGVASNDRRTTEGDALKGKIVSDALKQQQWVGLTWGAFTGWISGVGSDSNGYASGMKGHGVGYTTTTSNNSAEANADIADATHGFNEASAGQTESLNNQLAGFTSTYNSAANNAVTDAATDLTAARGDYEYALHAQHLADTVAMNSFLAGTTEDIRHCNWREDVANADLARAAAYRDANNNLASDYAAAATRLTTALNTADTTLVSSLSTADKDGTVSFSSAGQQRVTSFGWSGADLSIGGTSAELELGRALTSVGVTFNTDVAQAASGHANSVEAAAVTLAEATGEAAKILHIGQNSAAAQAAADAVTTPARATYDASVKAAGVTLAGDVGDAGITAADGRGSARLANTSSWNSAIGSYIATTNGAEAAYTSSTNSGLAGWVAATVDAQNADASALAAAFEGYINDIGDAEVDHEQEIGDADEEHAAASAQGEIDFNNGGPYEIDPPWDWNKCDNWYIEPCEGGRYASFPSESNQTLTNAQQGRQDYFAALGPAVAAHARSQAEAETARRVAGRDAQRDRDDQQAAADRQFINNLAQPIAQEANNSTAEGNNFASDNTGNVNDLVSDIVSSNGVFAQAQTQSDKAYDVALATAWKTYSVGLANLAADADPEPVEKLHSDQIAAAVRDDKHREADAAYTRATTQLDDALTFVTDTSSDSKDLSFGFAGIYKAFVVQVAPLIAQWNNSYAAASAGNRADRTDAANQYRSANAAASGARQGSNFAAQSTALAGMQSRAPSSFLASQQNLANQRASWWGGQHAAQLSNIAGRNAAESTHTQATNAASLVGPTAGPQSAAERINAAGVAYAGTTSTAYRTFSEELATHLNTYISTVAGAAHTLGNAQATATQGRDKALADAEYGKATNEEYDYAAAISAASAAYQAIVGPATQTFEATKKTASETRARDDAASQKDLDEAIATAEKSYSDTVAGVRADESAALSDADRERADALAALDAAFSAVGAVGWSNQLAGALAGSPNDPWLGLAASMASAEASRVTTATAARSSHATALSAALEDYEADLAGASQSYASSRATAAQGYTNNLAGANQAFTDTTGSGGAVVNGSNGFAAMGVGDGDEESGNDGDSGGDFSRGCISERCTGEWPKATRIAPPLHGFEARQPQQVNSPKQAADNPDDGMNTIEYLATLPHELYWGHQRWQARLVVGGYLHARDSYQDVVTGDIDQLKERQVDFAMGVLSESMLRPLGEVEYVNHRIGGVTTLVTPPNQMEQYSRDYDSLFTSRSGNLSFEVGRDYAPIVDELLMLPVNVIPAGSGAKAVAQTAKSARVNGGALAKLAPQTAARRFTHRSQWNLPADDAWKGYLQNLRTAYERSTGRELADAVSNTAARNPRGGRIWGSFNPQTERITLYRDWDLTTAFEELLHWEDLPRLKTHMLENGWTDARWDQAIRVRSGADWDEIYRIGEGRVRQLMIDNGFTPR